MLPNGLELCCPAAQVCFLHSRATQLARDRCVFARQPGQHQRVVRRRGRVLLDQVVGHELKDRRPVELAVDATFHLDVFVRHAHLGE